MLTTSHNMVHSALPTDVIYKWAMKQIGVYKRIVV